MPRIHKCSCHKGNNAYDSTSRANVRTSTDQGRPVTGQSADNRTVTQMKRGAIAGSEYLGPAMMKIGGGLGLVLGAVNGMTFGRILLEAADERPQYEEFMFKDMTVLMLATTGISAAYFSGCLLGGVAGLVVGAAVGGLHGFAKATAENVKQYVAGAPQPG